MPNDAYSQQALAADATFRSRTKAALSVVAWQVIAEDPATPNATHRMGYAQQVIRHLDTETATIVQDFVMRPNVFSFETSYVFAFPTQSGAVVTQSGDLDLQSQLLADWDTMAAAAGFRDMPVVP